MKKLLYFIGEDKAFMTHRTNVALAAKKAGFDVHLATHFTKHKEEIQKLGFTCHHLKYLNRAGLNPIRDIFLILELWFLFKNISPNVVHNIAWKPILYGSLMAVFMQGKKLKTINAFTGLGHLFTSDTRKTKLIRSLTCWSLAKILHKITHINVVQNPEDKKIIMNRLNLPTSNVRLILGSGVDTNKFKPAKMAPKGRLQFICLTRLLWDKGIQELIEATREVKLVRANFDVVLCGAVDHKNPSAIPEERITTWVKQGIIKWPGPVHNPAQVYQKAHVAILPTYREGLPKSLLEAAACGLPIITTDAPGCNEILLDGKNGLRAPVKDHHALAKAMIYLIDNPDKRRDFGQYSRIHVETKFGDPIIIEKYLRLYGKA